MSLTSNLGQLKDFLSILASHKGDVSNITAPPFVLSSKSVTELPAAWATHVPLFLAQGNGDAPALRALAVLKNFLCSLKSQQYTGRSEAEGIKKPINAFLGELFIAEFHEGEHTIKLISEQVSHHPPVTACFLYDERAGISAEGYVGQKVTFSPASGVTINQIGHATVHIDKFDEDHLLTLPSLRVKGVLTGSPYPELIGECCIVSSSGYLSRISFKGKGILGMGSKNQVIATLASITEPDKPLFEVSGAWNDTITIHRGNDGKVLESIDVNNLPTSELIVAPLDQQDPWETRKAWEPTIDGIIKQNLEQISRHKSEIESAQREMRKIEAGNGVEWPRLFFRKLGKHEPFERLARQVNEPLNLEHTNGIWAFIGIEASKSVKKPYHRDLTPQGQSDLVEE